MSKETNTIERHRITAILNEENYQLFKKLMARTGRAPSGMISVMLEISSPLLEDENIYRRAISIIRRSERQSVDRSCKVLRGPSFWFSTEARP